MADQAVPEPNTPSARHLAEQMYEAYQKGESKSAIEEQFLGTRVGHGKRFSAWVRRELGIETETRHPLVVENQRLKAEVAALREVLADRQGKLEIDDLRADRAADRPATTRPALGPLRSLEVLGFRSLQESLVQLTTLTCIIGDNGSGKSNLISAIRLLQAAVEEDLESAVSRMGGSDQVFAGEAVEADNANEFELRIEYKPSHLAATQYWLRVGFDDLGRAVARREYLRLKRSPGPGKRRVFLDVTDGKGFAFNEKGERREAFQADDPGQLAIRALGYLEDQPDIQAFRQYIESWVFLASDPARMREPAKDRRTTRLEDDASNIGPLLRTLERSNPGQLLAILDEMQLLAPQVQDIRPQPGREGLVYVEVTERGLARPLPLSLQSDGFLHFLAIATALETTEPDSLVVVEEPEHGLHPAAMTLLGELFRKASLRSQVLVTTHSPLLVDQLSPTDVAIAFRRGSNTVIERLDVGALGNWLESFTLGELWERHGLGDPAWFDSD